MPNRKPCFEAKGSLSRSRGMSKVVIYFRQRWKLSRRWRRCEARRRIHATGKRHCPLALPRNVSTPAAPLLPGLPQVASPLPAAYVDGCVFVCRRLAGAHGRKAELAARRATAFRRLRARTARPQVSVRLKVSSPNTVHVCVRLCMRRGHKHTRCWVLGTHVIGQVVQGSGDA